MLKLHLEILYNFSGSLVGLWLTPSDYNDEGTKETGLEGVDPTTPISDLQKLVEVAVKSECQKYRKENEATNDPQIYQKGEVEQVLTAELLNAVVEDKVTQVFGKYIADLQEKIDNIEGKLDLQKNEDVQKSETTPEHSENNYLERLQKLEGYIQKKDPNPSAKYVERIYAFLSPSAFKIKELFRFVTEQAYSSFPNNTNVTIKGK